MVSFDVGFGDSKVARKVALRIRPATSAGTSIRG